MKPKILISSPKENMGNYVNAVNCAGGEGTAFYLPKVDLDYDGLLICGGVDIHPKFYGEEISGAVNIDLARDEAELALTEAFVKAGKPVLGICRGCQILNIYFGGTIIQDLPNATCHRTTEEHRIVHNVKAKKGSFAQKLYGDEFPVNSYHHQAVKKLGNDLEIVMNYDDGVVEGFCHKTLPVIATQWHPEKQRPDVSPEDVVDGILVFEYFIKMCKGEV